MKFNRKLILAIVGIFTIILSLVIGTYTFSKRTPDRANTKSQKATPVNLNTSPKYKEYTNRDYNLSFSYDDALLQIIEQNTLDVANSPGTPAINVVLKDNRNNNISESLIIRPISKEYQSLASNPFEYSPDSPTSLSKYSRLSDLRSDYNLKHFIYGDGSPSGGGSVTHTIVNVPDFSWLEFEIRTSESFTTSYCVEKNESIDEKYCRVEENCFLQESCRDFESKIIKETKSPDRIVNAFVDIIKSLRINDNSIIKPTVVSDYEKILVDSFTLSSWMNKKCEYDTNESAYYITYANLPLVFNNGNTLNVSEQTRLACYFDTVSIEHRCENSQCDKITITDNPENLLRDYSTENDNGYFNDVDIIEKYEISETFIEYPEYRGLYVLFQPSYNLSLQKTLPFFNKELYVIFSKSDTRLDTVTFDSGIPSIKTLEQYEFESGMANGHTFLSPESKYEDFKNVVLTIDQFRNEGKKEIIGQYRNSSLYNNIKSLGIDVNIRQNLISIL